MKLRRPLLTSHSLQELKALIEAKSISLPEYHEFNILDAEGGQGPESEEKLFIEAMAGVNPLARDDGAEEIFRRSAVDRPDGSAPEEEAETLSRLSDLVKYGTGFNILDTPEYVEGTGYNVPPEFARRLHRGEFSMQAHIDLHGMNLNDAREMFERFLRGSVVTGKRGVLIIHGRGLSGPSEPVLKTKLIEWLTRGPWRKWVIAYCSARLCDGGTGATYLLLRQRPVSKRLKGPQRKLRCPG